MKVDGAALGIYSSNMYVYIASLRKLLEHIFGHLVCKLK